MTEDQIAGARLSHPGGRAGGAPAGSGPLDNHCPMLRRLERLGLERDGGGFVPKKRMKGEFRRQLGASRAFAALFDIAPLSPSLRATLANLSRNRVDFGKLGGDGFFNHRWRSGIFGRNGAFDPDAFARMAASSADGESLTLAEWCSGVKGGLAASRVAGANVPHDPLPTAYESVFVAFEAALLFTVLGRTGADGAKRVRLDEVRAFFAESRLPDREPRPRAIAFLLDNTRAAFLLARPTRTAPGGRPPPPALATLVEGVHRALTGVLVDRRLLLAALSRVAERENGRFHDLYRLQYGRDLEADLRRARRFRRGSDMSRVEAYVGGRRALGHAIGLKRALDRGDEEEALRLLDGPDAGFVEEMKAAYRARFGCDLEYDMRGFSLDWAVFRWGARPKLSLTRRGLRGEALRRAYRLLHGARLEANAARIAALVGDSETSDAEGRREIYGMLALAGGEERSLLDEKLRALTGKDLVSTLRPVFRAHARENAERPVVGDPARTAAIVVSSGNWSRMLSGEHAEHIGGYHWQEFYDEAVVAFARGWSIEFFTPEGLPPSPDALSLLEARLGPRVGFGLAPGTGPDSDVGRRIFEAFRAPRPLALDDGSFAFDASRFGTFHVAGGHGSPHDVVNNPFVERAAREMHERGRIISAVCHATSALGPLLQGGNTTGFPKLVDDVMSRMGYVLEEFLPPFDTHRDLRERVGARVSRMRATLIPMHTEVYRPGGGRAEIHTGTGPIATAPMARKKYAAIEAKAGAPR